MTVQKTMELLTKEYNDIVSNTPHILNLNADATVVNNFKRNIGYNGSGNDTYDSKTGFAVTYDIVCVIRDHPIRQLCQTEEEINAYFVTLFGAAREVFDAWCKIAFSLWDGDVIVPAEFTWKLPHSNTPCITVFANMTDASGRTFAMTLTEQSNLSDAVARLGYCNWLYDEMSGMSMGIDLNNFGKTSYGLKASSPKKKTTQKTKEKLSLTKVKKEDVHTIETVTEMMGLPTNTQFKINIQKITMKVKGDDVTLNFYGYDRDIHNNLVPNESNGVYVYNSRNEYNDLLNAIKDIDPTFGDTTFNIILSTPITISTNKVVTGAKKVYYTDTKIL